jgi:nickel-dependent lactate racemase
MHYSLKYGSGEMTFSLSDGDLLGLLQGRDMKKASYPRATVLDSIHTPIGSKPFLEVIAGRKGSVAIVVPDRTRTAKIDIALPIIIGELNNAGIPDERITIVFACGTHRPHTLEEQKKIVGPFVAQKSVKLVDHDCRDESNFVELGTTSRGNRIRANKIVANAELKILLGGITYHYFAGFGGGRKTILPGISAFETIQYNHKLLMAKGHGEDPHCTTGNLEGNPVHEDMLEAAKMLKPDFIVNTILNGDRELAAVFSGDLEAAHLAGCKFVDEYARVKIDKKADAVIASAGGGTKDMSFVQSHKAMENASYALKEGGTMILAAESTDGDPTEDYMRWIELGSSEKIEERLRKNFTIPGHTVYSAVHKAERFRIIWITGMDNDIVRKMKMTPADTIEEALKLAGKLGPAYIMPDAYMTLPSS